MMKHKPKTYYFATLSIPLLKKWLVGRMCHSKIKSGIVIETRFVRQRSLEISLLSGQICQAKKPVLDPGNPSSTLGTIFNDNIERICLKELRRPYHECEIPNK